MSVAIKDVRTSVVCENHQSISPVFKALHHHVTTGENEKDEQSDVDDNVDELDQSNISTAEQELTRISTPSQANMLDIYWENILSGENDDALMSALEDTSSQMLPYKDDDNNLHGRPISYDVAKVLKF